MLIGISVFQCSDLNAQTTWDGGGLDATWTNDDNWTTSAPTGGDLVFTGSTNVSTDNDLTAGTSFGNITFDDSGATAGDFILAGNSIATSGNIVVNTAAATIQTLQLDIETSGGFQQINSGSDLILSGILSGAGGIDKRGAGTLTVSGANTYAGSTVVSEGTLKLGASDTLVTTQALSVGDENSTMGATLDLAGFNQTVTAVELGGDNAASAGLSHSIVDSIGGGVLTVTGTVSYQDGGANSNAPATISADIFSAQHRQFSVEDGSSEVDLLLSGDLEITQSAGARFIKTGAGTVRLTGNNTYGRTYLQGGTLQFESSSNLGTSWVELARGDSSTLEFVGSSDTTYTEQIRHSNGGDATLLANGTGGAAVTYTNFNNNGTGTALIIGGNSTADNTINTDIDEIADTSLTKIDNGKWVISATQSYTGFTAINGGTLIINGNSAGATGDVTVATGATLGGSGTIGGATVIQSGGSLAPGNSAGVLTVASNVTLNNGSTFVWELLSDTDNPGDRGAASGFDGLDVTGSDFEIQDNVTFSFLADGGSVDFTSAFWQSDQSWEIIDFTGTPTLGDPVNIFDINTASITDGTNLFSSTNGSLAFEHRAGDGIYLNFTAVPEPGTYALMGLGLGAFGWAVRRRRKVATGN